MGSTVFPWRESSFCSFLKSCLLDSKVWTPTVWGLCFLVKMVICGQRGWFAFNSDKLTSACPRSLPRRYQPKCSRHTADVITQDIKSQALKGWDSMKFIIFTVSPRTLLDDADIFCHSECVPMQDTVEAPSPPPSCTAWGCCFASCWGSSQLNWPGFCIIKYPWWERQCLSTVLRGSQGLHDKIIHTDNQPYPHTYFFFLKKTSIMPQLTCKGKKSHNTFMRISIGECPANPTNRHQGAQGGQTLTPQ